MTEPRRHDTLYVLGLVGLVTMVGFVVFLVL